MTIKEMHYDFKQKLNKIDSEQYRNLRIPEIDWKLNEAVGLFIKIIAEPKVMIALGFEISQRVIDDIRTIVVNSEVLDIEEISDTDDYLATLPDDYQHYVGYDRMVLSRDECSVDALEVNLIQHNDNANNSPFDEPSFEWREANIRFFDEGIRIFTGGEFEVDSFSINYIRQHAYMHNAEDYTGGTYNTIEGAALTGTQDCELPKQTHGEIVDLAVAITSGDLQIPDYQVKRGKLNLSQIN